MPTRTKVLGNFSDRTLEHDSSLVHENEAIKRVEDLGRGLMNRKQDGTTGVCYLLQHLTQLHSTVRIEPRSRLIQKDKSRLDNQFHSHTGTLALTTGNTLDQLSAHNGIRTRLQTQLGNHAIRQFFQLTVRRTARQTEFGRKPNSLAGRRRDLERIVLRDKGNELANSNVGRVDRIVIEANIRLDLDAPVRSSATSENVEQRGLSSSCESTETKGGLTVRGVGRSKQA